MSLMLFGLVYFLVVEARGNMNSATLHDGEVEINLNYRDERARSTLNMSKNIACKTSNRSTNILYKIGP